VLNLQLALDEPAAGRVFYWVTYALTWALPAAGLWVAIREKDRALLGVNLITAIITLLTHKSYLHWARHTWDPIVFGITLAGIALGLRRWLAAGPGGARNGFTPQRLLEKERAALSVLGAVSLGVQPVGAASQASPDTFGGGRSGGGGAGASY
jgi:predicted small integral membrane protein